jgi:aminoglycoside 3-N-acetyltransferase
MKQATAHILPVRLREFARQIIRRYRARMRQRMPKIDESEFRRLIHEDLMLIPGAVVFIHSSLEKINLDFPSYKMLRLLQEAVGEHGTLLFPCTHLSEPPFEYYGKGKIFDVKKSPTTSGLLSEFARRQPNAFRSLHPTHSVVALGKHAKDLTADHGRSIFPFDEQSPYHKISTYDGLIVGLGVNTEYLTVAHCVEDLLKERFPIKTYSPKLLDARVRDSDGFEKIVRTLVHGKAADSRHIPNYMRRHIPQDVCSELKIHGTPYYVAKSGQLISRMRELAMKGITIYSV